MIPPHAFLRDDLLDTQHLGTHPVAAHGVAHPIQESGLIFRMV